MTRSTERGLGAVLANPHFRSLWVAQWLAQIAQNAINFMQLILIERLTGSTVQIGVTILAFTLPGVIFGPAAGVIADRFPKKWVLLLSNLARVLVALGYLVALALLRDTWLLVAIYVLTFLMSMLSQFFGPAEAAVIPLLVGEERLLSANSLFSLTMVLSQMSGLVIIGPLIAKLFGMEGGFFSIAAFYLGATVMVALLPLDRRQRQVSSADAMRPWQQIWAEFGEGVRFIATQPKIKVGIAQLVTINTLVMVLAMLVPGYVVRVLGMSAENAVIVFAPAGIGMLAATAVVGRWGYRLRRIGFDHFGLALGGLAFAGMGLLSLDYHRFMRPILQVVPEATFSLASTTMALAVILGFNLASTNILAQTTVQQDAHPAVRGRVLSVQFTLANLAGIVPMLALGGLADVIGIPRVLAIVGAGAILVVSAIFVRAGPALRPAWTARLVEWMRFGRSSGS